MMKFFKYGACAICGSLRVFKVGVCKCCYDTNILSRVGAYSLNIEGLRVRYLISWPSDKSEGLSLWVKKIKNAPPVLWMELAEMFVQSHELLNKDQILHPCPTRKGGSQHSQRWSQAVSHYLGCVEDHGLKLRDESKTQQKEKSKMERRERRMKYKDPINFEKNTLAYAFYKIIGEGQSKHGKNENSNLVENNVHLNKPLIFMDDIITTGATSRAAFEALKRPTDFEVWVVLHRPKN